MNRAMILLLTCAVASGFFPATTDAFESYKVTHSKAEETPNPGMADTVKWLNDFLGKECLTNHPNHLPWQYCSEFSLQYKPNPPTLVVHGQYTSERNGKPFAGAHKGMVPVHVNVDLGSVGSLAINCHRDNGKNYITPYYLTAGGRNEYIDTGRNSQGIMYHLSFHIDQFRGNRELRCERVAKALKHLVEHAPKRAAREE